MRNISYCRASDARKIFYIVIYRLTQDDPQGGRAVEFDGLNELYVDFGSVVFFSLRAQNGTGSFAFVRGTFPEK